MTAERPAQGTRQGSSAATDLYYSLTDAALTLGVLPLQLKPGDDRKTLRLTGNEQINLPGLYGDKDARLDKHQVLCRIDTLNEVEYFKAGGILHYALRQLLE